MPGLRSAFLTTSYGRANERVQLTGSGPDLRPDWAAPGERWAILTAWNPGGRQAELAVNAARQAALTREVHLWSPLPGWNGEGAWREDTLIVRGMPLRAAVTLGAQFGQAAVVWGVGRRAALVWLGGGARVERLWLRRAPGSTAAAGCGYTAGL
ncbi:DUF3293 domain-containing protein [Deinococcus radiotolerans]|uniref:DUF3293 domain-containing protein n=1 Tax=Deinococcus radiotolerans TaxID=1309407 RepID=A0ABQ2FGC5_9DEIO|nr:DUF3293 domain-containing protein [Deinococcus radiotolerans]GGK86167.1 hypothetical protein GCM10010844_00820 [Deinococcus radiotolerans]